jgi:hypothetical protein
MRTSSSNVRSKVEEIPTSSISTSDGLAISGRDFNRKMDLIVGARESIIS